MLDELMAEAWRVGTHAKPAEEGKRQETTPKQYLIGWIEILNAVGLRNDDSNRGRVIRLNERYEGPIISGGQGGQSMVEKDSLIRWWNGLEKRWGEHESRDRDAQATVGIQYQYGKSGNVVPEIGGSVKRRAVTAIHSPTDGARDLTERRKA